MSHVSMRANQQALVRSSQEHGGEGRLRLGWKLVGRRLEGETRQDVSTSWCHSCAAIVVAVEDFGRWARPGVSLWSCHSGSAVVVVEDGWRFEYDEGGRHVSAVIS